MKKNLRLILGTAQLGMDYGIANKTGRPDFKRAESIVRAAWEGGITLFDTAQAYGDSESVLAHALISLGIRDDVKIISKLHPKLDHLNRDTLFFAVEKSLKLLGVPKIHCLMLHREEMLDLWNSGLKDICGEFIQCGLTEKIGVSVYSPQRAVQALDTEGMEFVQAPTNILDQRFHKAGVFSLGEKRGKQIHVRSIFLQGLLLMNPKSLPGEMSFAEPVLTELGDLIGNTGLGMREIAMGYVRERFPSAMVLFGAETPEQVMDNLKSWNMELPHRIIGEIEKMDVRDQRIINPALWPERKSLG